MKQISPSKFVTNWPVYFVFIILSFPILIQASWIRDNFRRQSENASLVIEIKPEGEVPMMSTVSHPPYLYIEVMKGEPTRANENRFEKLRPEIIRVFSRETLSCLRLNPSMA